MGLNNVFTNVGLVIIFVVPIGLGIWKQIKLKNH
jgi:hypothetical protein